MVETPITYSLIQYMYSPMYSKPRTPTLLKQQAGADCDIGSQHYSDPVGAPIAMGNGGCCFGEKSVQNNG